jgi:hypothetical protein
MRIQGQTMLPREAIARTVQDLLMG